MITSGTGTGSAVRDARVVSRLNAILSASGLSVGKASTQIYAQPNHVHIIAPKDLAYLSEHATTLATNKTVVCDFSALSVVLWGMLMDVDRQLDEAAAELKIDLDRNLDVLRSDTYRASKAARVRAEKAVPAAGAAPSASLTGALVVAGADAAGAGSGGATPALRRAARLSGIPMAELSPSSTPDQVYSALFPALRQLARVTAVLRSLEEPAARGTMTSLVHITQVNVDTMAQLVLKLSDLLSREASSSAENPSLGLIGRAYSKPAHSLARMTELGLASVLLLLTAFARRPHIDIVPVVTVYNAVAVWTAAGLGELSTESYCRGLRGVIEALLPRQRDFEDNVEDVAAQLLLTRLAKRPPYQPESFRFLYFGLNDRDAVVASQGTPVAPLLNELGLLLMMSRVQTNLEFLFFPMPDRANPSATPSSAVLKSVARLRNATVRALQALESQNATLSFPQLLVLATVSGMPEVDLTNGDALVKRATETHLAAPGALDDARAASFLRLLIAYTYTVPTTAGASHGFISTESVTVLFQSIALHIFQMPLFEIEDGRYLSQRHVQAAMRTPALIKVVLFNIVHARLDETAHTATRDQKSGTLKQTEAAVHTSASAAPPPAASAATAAHAKPTIVGASSLFGNALDKAKAATAADLIAIDAFGMLRSMFRANNNREEMRVAKRTSGQTFSDALRAVTLNNITHIFTLFDDPVFVQQANFAMALRAVATIYALRVLHPLSAHANEMERRRAMAVMKRMQARLALIPQQMNRHDVMAVFLTRLVPLATAERVQHGNRLELGLMEAYLRSLATSSAANAIREDAMAKHWVDVALPCLTNRFSAALGLAAHDFLIAPFLARKSLSLLFVATYVAVFIPTSNPLYGEPNITLLKRFASFSRAACQGLEAIDNTELREQLDNPNSLLSQMAPNETARDAFRKLTPTASVLLIVSALFDKLCMVLNGASGLSSEARERFTAYFSSLVNLLQCTNSSVLQRVCASIEAVEVEHLQGMPQVQGQFLKYIGNTVDQVSGSTKRQVAEWYLRLTHKIMKSTPSKL